MIFKNMETTVSERDKSGCLWEMGTRGGRSKTTKLLKPCT